MLSSNRERTTALDPRLMTGPQKILFLAARADVCEKTARRWLRGESVKGSAGERCRFAADALGLSRVAQAA